MKRTLNLVTASLIFGAASLSLLLSGCTPAARKTAGTVVTDIGDGLCTIIEVLATAEGEPAVATEVGLLCPDAFAGLGTAISNMKATPGSIARRLFSRPSPDGIVVLCAGGAVAQSLGLPGRDPREAVCPQYRDQVLKTLGTNVLSTKVMSSGAIVKPKVP